MKLILIISVLFLSPCWKPSVAEAFPDHKNDPRVTGPLGRAINDAWRVSWERFFHPDTEMFYDYLSSYEKDKWLSHLPVADEVKRQYPNFQGYDTGMEDCMISAGVMLTMIVDKYAVTKDEGLRKSAHAVFSGIKRSTGAQGFLARCVCTEDHQSIYINSSRDQYTHAVHGLWYYFNSPLCDAKTRKEIRVLLSAYADRMIRNVISGNDYDFLRADGTRDTRGISRMWNVQGHEAARLPMIYAAAWNTTGNKHYYRLYRKYVVPAIEQSFSVGEKTTTYAYLQMACSLELLESLEKETILKEKISRIKEMVAERCKSRAENADKNSQTLDLTRAGTDWRTGEGLKPQGEYRKVWYNIRESGEAALTQLMVLEKNIDPAQKELLVKAIERLDYDRVSSNGIFYLQAAYWKARRSGVFNEND
ncbi:MAG: hypothetical protein J0H29_12590 [Sphingobacteriales bacterium]|nr:hypothetical protein [Sphingobacteriales bacterium]